MRAVYINWTGTEKYDGETSNLSNAFIHVISKPTVENFRGVTLADLYIVEHLRKVNIIVFNSEVSQNGIIE